MILPGRCKRLSLDCLPQPPKPPRASKPKAPPEKAVAKVEPTHVAHPQPTVHERNRRKPVSLESTVAESKLKVQAAEEEKLKSKESRPKLVVHVAVPQAVQKQLQMQVPDVIPSLYSRVLARSDINKQSMYIARELFDLLHPVINSKDGTFNVIVTGSSTKWALQV